MSTKNDSANWANTLSTLVEKGIIPNDIHRLLLYGPPATGKSAWAQYQFGEHVEKVLIHSQVPPEDLLGCVTLQADNGATTTVWNHGPVPKAMLGGYPIILDEVSDISSDMRCALHSILDDWETCSITLTTGEIIKPKKGFMVVATSNESPDSLPLALQTRFDLCVHCATPATGILDSLPSDYRETAKRSYERQEQLSYTPTVSIRSLAAMAKLENKLGRDVAASLIFGNEIGTDIVAGMATQSDS